MEESQTKDFARTGLPRLRAALQRLERLVGRGVVQLLDDLPRQEPMPLSTGHPALDAALGGGLCGGGIAEVFGPPSAGKTSLVLDVVRACQQQGDDAAFIDVDASVHRSTLISHGVDPHRLIAARPESGEHALRIVDELVRADACRLIVVDSVAGLVPRAELRAQLGEARPGMHARLMSQALRRLSHSLSRSRAVLIFTNQLRRSWGEDGVGVDVTTGGNALPFYAATRVELIGRGRMRIVKTRTGTQGALVDLGWCQGAPS